MTQTARVMHKVGLRYRGPIVKEDDEFITLFDLKTQHEITLKKSDLSILEVE